MKMKRVFLFVLILLSFSKLHAENEEYFRFSVITEVPPNVGHKTQPGLAGPYTGTDDGALIVSGGANFPDSLPWDGGTKKYYDDIFIATKNEEGKINWKLATKKLPFKAAYGGAVTTNKGLFCFGGNTSAETISATWFINFLPEVGDVKITKGPELPIPLTNFAWAVSDNVIYLAGGVSTDGESGKYFYSLDVSNVTENWKWKELPAWDGKARAFAVGINQSNGLTNCFYLFSGRKVQKNRNPEVLFDAHVYNPSLKVWSVISEGQNKEFPVMAGTAIPVGAGTILFTSGASGELMNRELVLKEKIKLLEVKKNNGEDVKEELKNAIQQHRNHLIKHPGFGNRTFSFNTITNEISEGGILPTTGQVTTNAVRWNEFFVIPSGEIRPGVRTPDILKVEVVKDSQGLKLLDLIVIALYFSVLAWMGYFFSKRQKSTNDYFKGGGRVPWWAAGLSIFGTALSAITFMAIPAKTYSTDWSYFMLNMTIFLVAPIIVHLFIPFYRKLNITTAYEYLEVRFNLVVRLIGSLTFIIFQIGRMGVVLFLPSIALNVVTGIDIFVCIALMGVVSLIYTMMGGIEAVIWTDVMQVIVLLGGALLSLALMIFAIDGGFQTIIETSVATDKFNVFDLEWSLKQPTVWVMLVGGMFASLTTYGTDQTMVQRYLTTKTQKEANKSVWTNAILTIPATLIFFFAGTALFVFFKNFPAELNPTFENNDAIFPWYITSQLPTGIAGLLIAAIFAAAMSSLSSSMNSAATAYATDIHFRFNWNKNADKLKLARKATLIIGVIGTLFAFMMATWDIKSLWDEFQKVLGLIIGGLGGVFLLGILSKRANALGVLIGLGASIIVQIFVGVYQPVHLLLYAATGFISCYVCGFVASLFFTKTNKLFRYQP